MSTTLNLHSLTTAPRRVPILAGASALVAAASISVTLAISGGDSDTSSRAASGGPAVAQPDRATLYRHGAELPQPNTAVAGQRAAERFHHR